MFKSTVTRLFLASLITVVAGAVVTIGAIGAAIGSGVFVMSGSDVTGVQNSPLAWVLLSTALVGGLAIVGGFIAGFVSWIGALLNTAQLDGKAWFLVLLLLGIFNFGFFAMLAYVIAGPDGKRVASTPPTPAPAAA